MGWLSSDKEKIRKYLGYPVQAEYLSQIQTRMDNVAGLSADAVSTAQTSINELGKIWDSINSQRNYAAAASHSNSGSSTDYYRGEMMNNLRSEGQRHARELAELLGLQVMRDVFATSSGGGSRIVRS
ncbi:MAG: hypothetical protein HC769_37245 [Cyanobacteria bacterium CRU_2_1]|nr:hypothetical protein [Cyanobacteria bacterium CRU_2_1]